MKNFIISGRTNIYGIIGDPIEHTVSPALQNAAFQEVGMNGLYLPFRVKSDNLRQAIEGLRALDICGINVTIPHKVSVIPYLDEIDTMAEYIGAVNTIVNNKGSLKGYNTDASGFLNALIDNQIRPEEKRTLIIGAGGAARAIAFILADKGGKLTIINRHLDRAQKLSGHLESIFRREFKAMSLTDENLEKAINDCEILINTTSLGMTPFPDNTPVPPDLLRRDMAVADIIYNPLQTKLVKDAVNCGAKAITGLEMLVYQGAIAFEIWTGHKAPIAIMRKEAIKELVTDEE
jgi:shikimate dehydrogenase